MLIPSTREHEDTRALAACNFLLTQKLEHPVTP